MKQSSSIVMERNRAPRVGDPVEIEGEPLLVDRLGEAIRTALRGRGACHVHLGNEGRCGEVVVRMTGTKGCIPLRFDPGELDTAYVRAVIRDTVEKYAL